LSEHRASENSVPQQSKIANFKRLLIGEPRDLNDQRVFHTLSLIPFLAWVGLGADGLSSSCYGPEEAFKTLGHHTYLAIGLVLAVIATISIISLAYTYIIEEFPHGGGGYNVAAKLLGNRIGVVSGCALLIDYILTITVSVASAGDQLFSLVPVHLHEYKIVLEVACIVFLVILNLRGVKESVIVLLPIFILFLITHGLLILGILARHLPDIGSTLQGMGQNARQDLGSSGIGIFGMVAVLVRAFSMGGGTYTGLEAVSNGLPIIREPRVPSAKRTMLYMAVSLSITAGGLLVAYLLVHINRLHFEGKTYNAVLIEQLMGSLPGARAFAIVTLFAAGALLVVAALGGFITGPRVMANMATDSWLPRHFASLSDRLTTQNGVLLMGAASLATLLYTKGNVSFLVVMYSINVFLTFTISMLGMLKLWISRRKTHEVWKKRSALFGIAFLVCITILCITTYEKFSHGGWITVVVTTLAVILCFMIKKHYNGLVGQVRKFDQILDLVHVDETKVAPPLDPAQPTAGILVGAFGGTGVHLLMTVLRMFPHTYHNIVFLSVGVIDSGQFKGPDEMEKLRTMTEESLKKYVELARRLGYPAVSRMKISTDVVDAGEEMCREIQKEFPQTTFFAGQLVFRREAWHHRFLHNMTSFQLQKRLLTERRTLVIVPMQV